MKKTRFFAVAISLCIIVVMLGVFSLNASAAEAVVAWQDADNDGVQDSGEATYTSLSAALSAGGTIKLAADYTLGDNDTREHYITMSSGTATLDLNGYELACLSLIELDVIVLSGTADLTITDSKTTGVLDCKSRNDVRLSDSAKLTIAGGTVETGEVHTQYYLSIYKSGSASFQIIGGKHYSNPTEYVAINHKVVRGDTSPMYTVSAIETNEVIAWNDADNDGVIDSGERIFSDIDTAIAADVDLKMNSDVFRDSIYYPPGALIITSTKTIDLNGYSISASAYCFEVKGGTLTIKDSAGGGQIWCQNDDGYSAISVYSGKDNNLIVESGTILGSITNYGAHTYPDAVVLNGGNYNFDPSRYIQDGTLAAGQDATGIWGIRAAASTACTVTISGEYLYTGSAITPTVVVKDGNGQTLTEGVDYTVTFENNVNFGRAEANVTFINDYRGSITQNFNIGCDHSHSEHTDGTYKDGETHNFVCTVCGATHSEAHGQWKYSANENIISSLCGSCGGEIATLSLNAPADFVYSTVAASGASVSGAVKGATVPAIEYCCAGGCIDAGEHTVSVTVDGKTASASFTINQAPLTVTAKDHTVTYGDAPANNGVTYTGFVGSDTESVIIGDISYTYGYEQYGNVGEYTIIPAGVTAGNYKITFIPGKLTVEKKVVDVTAEAKTKTYGDADPELTYITSGLVNGDTLKGALARAEGENVGEYLIGVGTLNNDNYTITYTGAKLTVEQKHITVTADDQSVAQYLPFPEYTYKVEGLVGEDTLLVEPTFSVSITDTKTVGEYEIAVDGADAGDNYSITYVNALLTVTDHVECFGGRRTCTAGPICEGCGKLYDKPLAHMWDEGVITTEATCTGEGVITYNCLLNRDHFKTEAIKIDETAHTDVDENGICDDCKTDLVPEDETTEAPEDETTEAPEDETTEAPEGETTEAPEDETTEAPEDETTEAPEGETTEAPEDETTEAPEDETTEAPEDETTEAPEDETTEAPTDQSTEPTTPGNKPGNPSASNPKPETPKTSSGCKGTVGGASIGLIALIGVGAFLAFKKKKEQ